MDNLIYNISAITVVSLIGYFLRQGLTNLFVLQDEIRPVRTGESLAVYAVLMIMLFVLQMYSISFVVTGIDLSKNPENMKLHETLIVTYSTIVLILGLGTRGLVHEKEKETSY